MHPSLRSSSPHGQYSPSEPLPWWKRTIDIACCIVALPFFAVCAVALAALHAVASPGPLLFKQERVGYMGRRFKLYKFRTMHTGADVAAHCAHVSSLFRSNAPMNKMDAAGDRRLVPGGWIVRATGLDELPQVLNVLRGEMSIVGPRPCIPYEYEQYTERHRARCRAVPGLTGLWQVSGKNRTTFEQMVQLDVRYAEIKSLPLDLSIIARTLPALWTQVRDTRSGRRAPAQATTRTQPATVPNNPAPTFQT
jgi:exopolysaccharide production protein ExoY